MTVQPFMKFYCSDWRADPRLRMCSLSARGLWIDLMSYMHEGEPYGHLVIDGKQPDLAGIASLVARPIKEVRVALAELEERNVCGRSVDGAIYSRRMVRDKAKAERDKANGKGGGNPKLKATDNDGVNPQDKAQIPEARILEPERKEDAAKVAAPKVYVFESGVIRLSKKDFDKWHDAFSHLDLKAELVGLTQWAGAQPDWYFAVSGALAKRNREIGLRQKQQSAQKVALFDRPYTDFIT